MNTTLLKIPGAIPDHLLNAVDAVWPSSDWPYWHRYRGETADKFGSMDRFRIPHAIQAALDHLAIVCGGHLPSGCFIDYDLHAAGLHQIPPGGYLRRHLDAECHPIRPWKREWSIVCNVNPRWLADWGGLLLIDGQETIVPERGTAIMFQTPGAWHEVSDTSDDADTRRTLALFAWSVNDCGGSSQAEFAKTT